MKHVLQLFKWAHQEAGAEQGHDIAQCVEDRKDIKATMQEEGKCAQKGQQDADYKQYAESLNPCRPAEGGHFVDLQRGN